MRQRKAPQSRPCSGHGQVCAFTEWWHKLEWGFQGTSRSRAGLGRYLVAPAAVPSCRWYPQRLFLASPADETLPTGAAQKLSATALSNCHIFLLEGLTFLLTLQTFIEPLSPPERRHNRQGIRVSAEQPVPAIVRSRRGEEILRHQPMSPCGGDAKFTAGQSWGPTACGDTWELSLQREPGRADGDPPQPCPLRAAGFPAQLCQFPDSWVLRKSHKN